MILCDFGCGQPAQFTFKSSGNACCSKSVNSCPEMKRKNSEAKIGYHPFRGKQHPRGMLGKKGKNQYIIAKENGTSISVSDETRKKISLAATGRLHSEETKHKISEATKLRRLNGWEPVCGRAKKYSYVSVRGDTFVLDGTWELLTAKYLDYLGLSWKKNKNKFYYTNLVGKESTYTPDFYVEDWDTYIEVKGYETELDRCKWSQFPHKLDVWRKDKIMEITKIIS